MQLLQGAVVLVTGGGRGIGAATVLLAAQQGAAVAVNYRQDERAAQALVSRIQAAGGRALAVQADVGQEADVARLFVTVHDRLGPLTALVNNAGMLEQQARVDELDAARLQRVLATNVIGAFLCAGQAVRQMSTRYGALAGSSSTCPRARRYWGRRASTWTTRPPRERWTP